MFVVCVEFEIAAEKRDAFLAQMIRNAEVSRATEAGCRQFDVCADPARPERVVLYEIYDDEAAFQLHCRSAHFQAFDDATAGMIGAKRIDFLRRLSP